MAEIFLRLRCAKQEPYHEDDEDITPVIRAAVRRLARFDA
jgi:hypothetical protein